MSLHQVLRGFATLASGMLFTQIIGFVALAYAARHLGPQDLGAATFALNVALYFTIPANFGIAVLGIRDIAREPERGREIAGEVLAIRIVLGTITAGAMVLLAPVIAADEDTRKLLPFAALVVVAGSMSGEWALLGLQRSGAVAFARFAGQLTYGLLVLLALGTGFGGAKDLVLYTTLSIVITSLVTLFSAWRAVGAPTPRSGYRAMRARVLASAPLGLAFVMIQVYQSIGAVLLGYLKSPGAVGQYGVAQKIPIALYGVMDLWGATLFPQAARLADTDHAELRAQVRVFMTLSLAIAVPLTVGGVIAGPDLIPLLFGDAYDPASGPFVVLLAGLAIALVTINPASVLAAGGHERPYAWALTGGAVLTVVLALVLIPLDGVRGAAFAVLGAELAILVFVSRRFAAVAGGFSFDTARALRIVAASAAMAGAMLLVGLGAGVLVQIAAGAAVYALAVPVFGVVRREELRLLRRSEPS
jgi:O-antigen/teichoic acid export membrane protein